MQATAHFSTAKGVLLHIAAPCQLQILRESSSGVVMLLTQFICFFAGALIASGESRAAVAGSRFEGGRALSGAAAEVTDNSSLSLVDSIVLGNTVGERGGGFLCEGNSSVTLSNSLVHGNNATFGGGICALNTCKVGQEVRATCMHRDWDVLLMCAYSSNCNFICTLSEASM